MAIGISLEVLRVDSFEREMEAVQSSSNVERDLSDQNMIGLVSNACNYTLQYLTITHEVERLQTTIQLTKYTQIRVKNNLYPGNVEF